MKLGIILNSREPETAWNALRLGNTALKAGHEVKLFLMGSGVEIENIKDDSFDTAKVLKEYIAGRGELLACGTCLKLRQQDAGACPISTMSDLLALITESDKVVTLG